MNKKWISLLFFLAIWGLIQWGGFIFTNSSVNSWFLSLPKPSWNPPTWLFAPVWTLLYLMIAISGWLLFLCRKSEKRTKALWAYGIQLFLNFLWPYFFFFLQNPLLGFLDIITLVVAIGMTIFLCWPLSRRAALLLVPYLCWTIYATALNGQILFLNS